MSLTIAYVTARRDPKIEWFFESLLRQINETDKFDIIIVDRYHDERAYGLSIDRRWNLSVGNLIHVAPKPSVWQGKTRLTNEEFFTPASYRNTALSLCRSDSIVFTDDLAVLMPTWFDAVTYGISRGDIMLGAYRKVKAMSVVDGELVSFKDHPAGHDSRWDFGRDDIDVPAPPGFLFGCSVGGSTEAFLSVNGWDERCDAMGLGSEDTMMGIMLERRGYRLKYSRRMLTYESEELHHVEAPLKRVIQKIDGREDASWEMLRMVRDTNCDYAPNYFPDGGIRALRDRMLNGNHDWPKPLPEHDWYSKRLLCEI